MPARGQSESRIQTRLRATDPSRRADGHRCSSRISADEKAPGRYRARAMGHRLSELIRSHYLDPKAWQPVPVLIWHEAPPPREKPELLWVTQGNHRLDAPAADPEIFRLEKSSDGSKDKVNAFALGVTLGRTSNNDVMIDDASVSRFHAYFQQDPQSGVWHVVDAESSNGSYLAGERLAPRRPAPLVDHARLQFGHVKLEYLLPVSFVKLLAEKINPNAPSSAVLTPPRRR